MSSRRSMIVGILVMLALALPAEASHQGSNCSASQVVSVSGVLMPQCSMTASCPGGAPHACRFTLAGSASGIGYVAARVFVPGQALPFTFCTGALSCTSSAPGYLVGPGQSKAVQCIGGDAAANMSVSCTATAT